MKNSSLYTNVRANQLKMAIFLIGFLLISAPGIVEAKLITVGTASDTVNFGNSVGIGTTAPWSNLTVRGTTSAPSIVRGAASIFSIASTDGVEFAFTTATSSPWTAALQVRDVPEGSGDLAYPLSLNPLGGNVGIGTTNPTIKLDVSGAFRNSLATTHSLLGGSGNVIIMADNAGSLFSATPAVFTASINVSTLYHIKKWFTPQAGQTISSSGTTVTMANPVASYQFSSSMVGSRLTINGESRVITAYTSTSVVTVDSAYSTNYSGVSDTLWGVYSRAVDIATDGSISTYSETGSMAIRKRSGDANVYVPALLDSSNNYYLPSSILYLDKDFPIKWSNSTSYSASSGNDVGLRRTATGTLEIFDGQGATPGTIADYRDLNLRNINPAGGNIGIGTTTASNNKLTVVSNQSGGGVIKVQNTNIASWSSYEMFDYAGVHKASFGYANPSAPTVAGLAHFSTSDDTPFIIAIHDLEKMRLTTEGYLGIGTNSPARPLHISSTSTDSVAAGNNNSMIMVDGLMNSTSRQQSGIVSSPWVNPTSTSVQTYIGLNFIPNSDSPYVSGAKIMGLYGGAYYHGTSTLGEAYGGIFKNFADDTSTITTSYGVYIDDAYKAAGATITNNYGLYVTTLTAGTNDYSIYSEGGANYFGGNVGVGATNASGKLTVAQNMTDYTYPFTGPHIKLLANNAVDTTGFVGITYAGSSSDNYGWSVGANRTSGGNSNFVWKYHTATASGTERMRININGNVGIGSSNPTAKLHIFDKTSAYATINLEGPTDTADQGAAILFNEGNGATQWDGGLYGFKAAYDGGNNYLYFEGFANGTSQGKHLNILRTGNVGIGTTAPNAKLYVSGQNVTFLSATSSNTMLMGRNATEHLYVYNDDTSVVFESIQDENTAGFGNMIFRVDNDGTSDGYFAFQNKAATEFMRITATGSVAIGTTAPVSRLSVVTSTFLDNAHAISFGSNLNYYYGIGIAGGSGTEGVGIWGGSEGTDKSLTNPNLFVKRGGNVGIGTTAPAAKLDVAGTVKLGTAGTAFTAMGTCTIASTAISTTPTNYTCTSVPASTSVAVSCSGAAAQSGSGTLYCRATGTANQVACNTSAANTTAMTWACMWTQL